MQGRTGEGVMGGNGATRTGGWIVSGFTISPFQSSFT